MDRAKKILIATLAVGSLAIASMAGVAEAFAEAFPLHEKRWLSAPAADVMAKKPSECLAPSSDPLTAYQIEVGRAAFSTPLLLGGQAARAKLTCESCHRNGRGNPDFFFSGLSETPGTADVTSSLLSSHRGDKIDNSKPIPDLGGPRAKLKVSRDPKSPALRSFIRGLVTQEFDGAEPPAAVLDGLAEYARALKPEACPKAATTPIRVNTVMADGMRAARTGAQALAKKDKDTALMMLAAARTQLGLVHERYAQLPREAAAILTADRQLAAIQSGIRDGRAGMEMRLTQWQAQAASLTKTLARTENRSLFDAAVLTKAATATLQ